jgi:hypothetical protein
MIAKVKIVCRISRFFVLKIVMELYKNYKAVILIVFQIRKDPD